MDAKNELHALRLEMRVTQPVMARYMGVSLRSYEELESGRTKLRDLHMNAARWACVVLAGEAAVERGTLPSEVREAIKDAVAPKEKPAG